MRGRLILSGACLLFTGIAALGQFPPPRPQTPPMPMVRPMAPPRPVEPGPTVLPDGTVLPAARVETPLPRNEVKFAIDPVLLTAKKVNNVWQIWMGPQPVRTVGPDETGARDIVRLLQDQRPTDWVAIGSPRPVVEYGLVNGRACAGTGLPRGAVPIDLRSVRLDALKGVWCIRDDSNILFNFGLNKADAEQALAVIRKYGFNRIGVLGDAAAPAMTYFFVAVETEGAKPVKSPLAAALQEQNLARSGIPVPGVGYVGEIVKLDWRKAEVRREGAEWVLASGNEIIASFAHDQNAARDSLRMIQDGQFNEFGRVGPTGANFFLSNGQVPLRLPLFVQGRRLDLAGLKVTQSAAGWSVSERGRHVFDVGSAEEGDAVIRLMKLHGFDQLCRIGTSPRSNLTFLAKGK